MSCRNALHASHRRTDAGKQAPNPQAVQQVELGSHHVKDGEDWESSPIPTPFGVQWVDGRRTCGAVAASEDVCADHKEAIRVEGLAGTDELFPPTSCSIVWVRLCMR